jgi:GalNAc5-diNAcBac-PP-undecaprenol beta-1,3-glucosyltransferase
MNDILVSCIIPTHNRCALLERAIKSVLYQSYSNLEAIVVDEASSDDTDALVCRFAAKDRRVRYIKNPSPLGPGGARNVGVASANGEVISFLDDDDVWLQEKIKQQLEEIKVFDAVHCGSRTRSGKPMTPYGRELVKLSDLKRGNLLGSTSCFMVKTSLMRANPFDEELACGEDWDLFIRLCQKVRLRYLPKAFVIYDDGNHVRLTNRIRCDRSQSESMLAVVQKHKEFLGSYWVRYHTACVLLSYWRGRPGKIERLFDTLNRCGLVPVMGALLSRARAQQFFH